MDPNAYPMFSDKLGLFSEKVDTSKIIKKSESAVIPRLLL